MKKIISSMTLILCLILTAAQGQNLYPDLAPAKGDGEVLNQLPAKYMPVIGVWVWNPSILEPEGYVRALDLAGGQSPFNLLIPFLRFGDKEVCDESVFLQVKEAAEYALQNHIALVPDIDVRSARRAFRNAYPDEMQQFLRIREVELSKDRSVETVVGSVQNMNDHYSGGSIPAYDPFESNLLKVFRYRKTKEGIDPASLQEISKACTILSHEAASVEISIPPAGDGSTHAAVMLAFTLFYPDIFGPHLMEFQRELIAQYADVPLAGICKDEWGFPPYFPRYGEADTYDYWYSHHRALEYKKLTGGQDLLTDLLLMALPHAGMKKERQVAVNHFREMSLQRNTALEDDFYQAVKENFGPQAAVTVHPTWWPYPDYNEMKKNGLDWWAVRRDWAQTDEIVPFGARTALSKKWRSPVWYHMYYTKGFADQLWSSALAGGRLNYLGYQRLYDRELMRAEARIRLLNTIDPSPLDCQVAIVFGHPGAMNWAGPHFNDVGMEALNYFWSKGYPADLIPTSEIWNGSLRLDEQGRICYGDQTYTALVLHHPELDKSSVSDFFLEAGDGPTKLYCVGDWTRDFEGKPVDAEQWLPSSMKRSGDYRETCREIIEELKAQGIRPQTPATRDLDTSYYTLRGFSEVSKFPPNTGFCRLLDGTVIHVAGTDLVSGDTIRKEFKVNAYPVIMDAVGVAAVRLDDRGQPEALAAGGLKHFKCGDLEIRLEERADLSLLKNEQGIWEGVFQAERERSIPGELLKITDQWQHILLPEAPEITWPSR